VPSVSWTDAAGRFALTGLQTGDRRLDIETALGPEAPVYVKLPRDELVIRLPRRATLSGTVVDQGGRPLSGALCRLAPRGPHGEEPSREVTTDAAGRFSFALLRPGPYRLSVERDGFRHFGTHVTLRPGEHQGGLTARLQPFPPDWRLTGNATVRGRVVRLDGTPAVGAEVTCLAAGRSQQAKTDATGAYRLTGLLAGAVHLAARLAGCASEPATGQAKANAETVLPDLKLAERLVRGRLVDLPPGIRPRYCLVSAGVLAQGADGREVPHTAAFLLPVLRETEEAWQRAAPVGVSPLWSDPEPMTHSPFGYLRFPTASRVTMGLQLGLADTDEPVLARGDGSFELPLGPGQQRLTVTTPYPRDGRGDLVTLAEVVVDIPERGPVALEVPLVLGTAVLAGQLTLPKAAGKAAVSRALWNVAAYRPGSWTPAATTLVRPDGGWRLAGLTPGDYRVVIGGYGGCRLQQATAHAGATTTVVCDTRPGHTLRGRLRARPARPMQLTVESDTAVQAVLVQPDGAFVLPDLPAGVYRCTLWAGHGTKLVRLPGTVTVPGADVVLDG
jgi:hypothetical protein